VSPAEFISKWTDNGRSQLSININIECPMDLRVGSLVCVE
jgi:hypothetical protein